MDLRKALLCNDLPIRWGGDDIAINTTGGGECGAYDDLWN